MLTPDLSLHASHGLPGDALMTFIGNTPLIPLVFPEIGRTVYGKCEFLNPCGSIKDRLARKIIQDAEGRGLLTRDHTLLECSSGIRGSHLQCLVQLAVIELRSLCRIALVVKGNTHQEFWCGINPVLSRRLSSRNPSDASDG